MLSDKVRKDLKRQLKRRQRRPEPKIVPVSELKASGSLERRMARDHLGLLQNIEFALVNSFVERIDEDVDDQVVDVVLRAAIRQTVPEEVAAFKVYGLLRSIRETRGDVSDDLWTDALRVVFTSVHRHSGCRKGEVAYLFFAAQYIV